MKGDKNATKGAKTTDGKDKAAKSAKRPTAARAPVR
jgi:hypothetical protein